MISAPAGFVLRHAYTYINHRVEVDEEISWRFTMHLCGLWVDLYLLVSLPVWLRLLRSPGGLALD